MALLEHQRIFFHANLPPTDTILGVATLNMKRAGVALTQKHSVQLDATHAMTRYGHKNVTVMGVGEQNKGQPVMWGLMADETAQAYATILSAYEADLERWVALENPELGPDRVWAPSCFLVDASDAERAGIRFVLVDRLALGCSQGVSTGTRGGVHAPRSALTPPQTCSDSLTPCRSVFGPDMPIFLCIWHVQKAWLTQLRPKLHDTGLFRACFQELVNLMNLEGEPDGDLEKLRAQAAAALEAVLDLFAHHGEERLDQFLRKEWAPKAGELQHSVLRHGAHANALQSQRCHPRQQAVPSWPAGEC